MRAAGLRRFRGKHDSSDISRAIRRLVKQVSVVVIQRVSDLTKMVGCIWRAGEAGV